MKKAHYQPKICEKCKLLFSPNSGMAKIGLGIYATAIKSLFLILVIIGVAISAIIKWEA